MRIAIIDSGVPKYTRLNIYKRARIFMDENLNAKVTDTFIEDAHGHATLIMNIIGNYLDNAKVLCLKVLDKNLSCNSLALIRALQFVLDENVKIVNLSLGEYFNFLVQAERRISAATAEF